MALEQADIHISHQQPSLICPSKRRGQPNGHQFICKALATLNFLPQPSQPCNTAGTKPFVFPHQAFDLVLRWRLVKAIQGAK